jgi:putative N-acylglucosamine-6-phosphate 2-epimerase
LHHPQDLAKVMRMGAFAACVGTAITHPTTLTRWFTEAIEA